MYFKMYLFMFMTLCLFGHVEAKCLANTPPQETTSSSGDGCRKTYTPECGNLTSLFVSEPDTFEQDGCTMFKCPAEFLPFIRSSFDYSELPKPTDEKPSLNNNIGIYALKGEVEDISSRFGIVCDGNKWKVTKYPYGIWYMTPKYVDINLGDDGSYDGIKSEILRMGCTDYVDAGE